jgi:hypothetical protein
MHRFLVRLTPLVFAVPLTAGGQTGGFLVRLGSDTIAIERYTRSANKIEGMLLRRTPQTNILKYTIGLNADGTVSSYEQMVTRADGSPAANAPATPPRMNFVGDSVVRQILQSGQPATLRAAAPKGTLPTIGGSWLASELQIQSAKKNGAAYAIGFGAQQAAPIKLDVRFIGNDSAEIVNAGFRTGFKLDRNGRIARGDGALTTQKMVATPATIDVNAVATAWAAKDAAGQAMGAPSTRDTVRATVGSANVWIDYGRPAKRGREIWGKLVPYDTTWRMGANAAAQFRTDKDLDIGGATVPAGFYTIWLLPSAGTSYLIVNKQTGQWGTAYDASQDLVRIPVVAHMNLPASEERFRIIVQGDMLMMHWDRGGYGVKIASK